MKNGYQKIIIKAQKWRKNRKQENLKENKITAFVVNFCGWTNVDLFWVYISNSQ